MQLSSLLISTLFALSLHAAPVTDEAGHTEVFDGKKIFERSGQSCRVLSEHVNCRYGPGTNYDVKVQLSSSWTRGYYFTCVKSGECITLNGAVNCGWDYFEEDRCYVNGHYTDSSCSLAKLGRC